jgi:DNA invertase Pin-like site-specific DNA recombinase
MDKKAAIYARTAVSQEHTNYTLERQIEQCKAYCQEHGYMVEENHIYREEYNGATDYQRRPRLGEALQLATMSEPEKLPFNTFVIFSIDRLSRDHSQAVAIIEQLQQHNITVESIEGPVDLAFLEMIQDIKRHVTRIERQKIKERTQYAKASRKAQV